MRAAFDPGAEFSRRQLLATGAAAAAGLALGPARLFAARRPEEKQIVLYCSADNDLAQPVIDAFTKATGINVKAVYDTEATKTTGLTNRLLAEKERPRADVWWSSEPFGTIRLARAGVLEPYASADADAKSLDQGGWPKSLRGKDKLWYGFGSRARVFGYNTEKLKRDQVPTSLLDMNQVDLKGRIGMARPQFGTTRGHMAAYAQKFTAAALKRNLKQLRENGLRLFDGNAAVARALGTGEIYVGLTDSDDVFAGQAQKWPIDMVFEGTQSVMINAHGTTAATSYHGMDGGIGPLFLPNTIALVHGGANGAGAQKFIDFVLSKETQRSMASGESRNVPVDPALRDELTPWAQGGPAKFPADYEAIADHIDEAMKACEEALA